MGIKDKLSMAKAAFSAYTGNIGGALKGVVDAVKNKGGGSGTTTVVSAPAPPAAPAYRPAAAPPPPDYSRFLKKSGSSIGKLILILVFVAFFLTLSLPYIYSANFVPPKLLSSITIGFQGFFANFGQWWTTFNPAKSWSDFLNKQTAYATGGYYEGQVDQKKAGPDLGVTITQFKAQRATFTEKEPVALWADIQARALGFDQYDQQLSLTAWCEYRDPITGKTVKTKVNSYQIYQYGEEYVDCSFGNMTQGAYTVKADAEFDFSTHSYLKTYFMDASRLQIYRMQNKDPLTEFDVTDPSPVSVYTNGPVAVSIGTNENLPLPVPSGKGFSSIFGVTIENQNPNNGIIMQIKSVQFQLPEALSFDPDHCDFVPGTPTTVTDSVSGERYNVYTITPDGKKITTQTFSDIDRFITLNCRLDVDDSSLLLGNSPFATKYLRASVDYDYLLTKQATVIVQKAQSLT